VKESDGGMATRPRKKKASRKRRPARAAAPRPAGDQIDQPVRVRMYRLGLGECFLVSFARLGLPFHMLIDCGRMLGRRPAGLPAHPPIRRVVEDIRRVTGGRLDVLLVTHKHNDRLSGFLEARQIFEAMAVEQVWLGWTEDPMDMEARWLTQRRGFGGGRNEEAMLIIRRIGGSATRYWRGGDGPVALSGVPGSRVYFLAPPTTSRGSVRHRAPVARATESPFDPRYRLGLGAARSHEQLGRYFADHEAWRSATAVADVREIAARSKEKAPPLRMDAPQEVNNTSLVIAIELTGPRGERKVLLFPGDAQLASWWSWHEHRWPPDDPNGMTTATLLRNTVLYKVSHKGAWSGTPMAVGLDMMTSPELVAMIPVDHRDAQEKRWQMPAPELLAALERRTRGRVIRADTGVPTEKPQDLSDLEWEDFRQSVAVTPLYIDYQVSIAQLTAGAREKLEANWTAANERRVFLIDKKLAGTIRPEEEAELREIDRLVDEYMSATAPGGADLVSGLRDNLQQVRQNRDGIA